MKKIDFKKILKKIFHWLSKIGSDADNDWKVIFIIFIVSFLFIAFLNTQTFFAVQVLKSTGASLQAKKTEFIDAHALSDVLGKYNARARGYAKLASTTPNLVDPSR
jgi:hypothetical protein